MEKTVRNVTKPTIITPMVRVVVRMTPVFPILAKPQTRLCAKRLDCSTLVPVTQVIMPMVRVVAPMILALQTLAWRRTKLAGSPRGKPSAMFLLATITIPVRKIRLFKESVSIPTKLTAHLAPQAYARQDKLVSREFAKQAKLVFAMITIHVQETRVTRPKVASLPTTIPSFLTITSLAHATLANKALQATRRTTVSATITSTVRVLKAANPLQVKPTPRVVSVPMFLNLLLRQDPVIVTELAANRPRTFLSSKSKRVPPATMALLVPS